MRATVSWAVKITDYEVSPDQIIGEPGAWVRDPRTYTLGYVTNHIGTAQGAFDFTVQYVKDRPYLAQSELIRVAIGQMASNLEVSRAALYTCARMWEDAYRSDWDRETVEKAELLGLQALHVTKAVALDVTRRVFDVCGARAAFKTLPLEAMYRDVRTFTLHHRDDDYMLRVANAVLGDRAEGLQFDGYTTPLLGRSAQAISEASETLQRKGKTPS
jgi:alkylation response protein AidB-like acyl-CoA dehydrogenase